jgi:dethiobiotin synthase
VLRGLFVTGTDTGVGKTVVAAALMLRYRRSFKVRYWKPVQTGIERDDDTREVRRLASCSAAEIVPQGVRLPRPLSPHLAARLSGQSIDIDQLLSIAADGYRAPERWLIEGAGGILVPLNDSTLTVDLVARLRLPVVVVARSRLGTINHTLLTLEALRARAITIAAVVMTGPRNPENKRAIQDFGHVPVLGELPRLRPLGVRTLRNWAVASLDPDGVLEEQLR